MVRGWGVPGTATPALSRRARPSATTDHPKAGVYILVTASTSREVPTAMLRDGEKEDDEGGAGRRVGEEDGVGG